jgi:hypothetical protein
MKFISHQEITPIVCGYYIHPMDLEVPKDKELFVKLLKSLFRSGDELFFIACGREKQDRELDFIREQFYEFGDLKEVELDGGYDDIAWLCRVPYEKERHRLIFALWASFRSLRFFNPLPDLDWSTFSTYDCSLFESDPEGKKMFAFNFMNYLCIKGSGGESMMINYKKDHALPDIQLLAGL